MCWCWSEQPHQRPSFQQILEILKAESFTTLLASAQIMDPIKNITTACASTQLLPFAISSQSNISPSFKNIMKILHNTSSETSESGVQVWYGTRNGQCEMLQFQPSATSKKV